MFSLKDSIVRVLSTVIIGKWITNCSQGSKSVYFMHRWINKLGFLNLN